jgi:hypothetical protein
MAKKNTEASWDNLISRVQSRLKWGEEQTSSPQSRTVVVKSTGQGDPDEQAAVQRLAEDPEFKHIEDQGITKEDLARYIQLMHDRHPD